MASMAVNLALSTLPSAALGKAGAQQNSSRGWPCFRSSASAVTSRRWQDGTKCRSFAWEPSGARRNKSKFWRESIQAAQGTAQAETVEDEEVNADDRDGVKVNGRVPSSELEPLLRELKEAIAANDEKLVAKLETQIGAMESERESLRKQVLNLIEEVQSGKERLLRLSADFDNYRKRSEKEKAKLASTVRGDMIETLLPMVDNFERAKSIIRTVTEGEDKIDRSYQGIYKQFVEIMKGLDVVAVETVGKVFDPNLHEAIMREDSTEFEEGIVVQEFRRGFAIGSKLVRPAMVKVSSGPGKDME